MENHKKASYSIKSRLKSFEYAFNGLKILFRGEPNILIHLMASIVVIIFGFYFEINKMEWLAIITAIGLVWISEIFNTAIEYVCDGITTEIHPLIKKVKNVAAAGVLVAAILAVIIGGIIFIPKILSCF